MQESRKPLPDSQPSHARRMIDLFMYRARTNTARAVTWAVQLLIFVVWMGVTRSGDWWLLLAVIPIVPLHRLAVMRIDQRA